MRTGLIVAALGSNNPSVAAILYDGVTLHLDKRLASYFRPGKSRVRYAAQLAGRSPHAPTMRHVGLNSLS